MLSSLLLPLSRQTVTYTLEIIRRYASRSVPLAQARSGLADLLILVYLHKCKTFAELATRCGISTASA
jgi:hypothetical protein